MRKDKLKGLNFNNENGELGIAIIFIQGNYEFKIIGTDDDY